MVDVKSVVVSVVAVLSVFLKPGIRAQPTTGSSSEDDYCSQMEEEWEFQVEENIRLQMVVESQREKIKYLEGVSSAPGEKNQQRNLTTQPGNTLSTFFPVSAREIESLALIGGTDSHVLCVARLNSQ